MKRRRDRSPVRARRAALLLEVMLALALLVTSSSLVVAVVRDSSDRLARAMDMGAAAELGHTAIAQIESGLATPETLSGAAPVWTLADELDTAAGPALASDDIAIEPISPASSEWFYEIETQTTGFDGLTLLSVTTTRQGVTAGAATLHALVRLSGPEEDDIGDDDELDELVREVNTSEPETNGEATP